MDYFETMHTCCGYIEDVHVNFWRQNIIFDKITAILTLTFQTLVSSIDVLRVMGEDGARGRNWLRAWGHHLCLTDTIF